MIIQKKSLMMKEKDQHQEEDLEIDETLKSNFENLDNLVYEQELKVNLWNSVKEFKEQTANDEELIKETKDLITPVLQDIVMAEIIKAKFKKPKKTIKKRQ